MISSFIELYPTAKITYIQSTFLELATDVELHRIEFIGKVEARLKRGIHGELQYRTAHYLLTLYHEPLAHVFLNSRSGRSEELIEAIDQLILKLPGGWRSQWLKFQSRDTRQEMVRVIERGRGHLLNCVPQVLADEVETLCWLYDANTTMNVRQSIPRPLPAKVNLPFAVLFIGNNYVIAQDFYISTLWSAPTLNHFSHAWVG
ncbi:hypothetical protein [Hymenobacter norwichensis]|uniref:hypothetical protein n=1 Tax=Hymenobacter norwichensis TaxID=223903 RepID=UPI0012F9C336|nr:hypothetical protein [Hymenobacter norwichensis]